MPNGFPTIPLRDDYGPEPVNQYPVRDPNKELDGESTGRLMFHQLSGLGLMSHLAAVAFDNNNNILSAGADRSEAWNTKRATGAPYAAPIITRPSVGLAVITYLPQYPDHTGAMQPLIIRGGYAVPFENDGVVWNARVLPSYPYTSVCSVESSAWNGAGWSPANPLKMMVVLR